MDNIWYDFDEKVISLIKNFLFNSEENENLSSFTDNFVKEYAKMGKEYLIKTKYVLDEFHMKKAVNNIVGRITKPNKKENKNKN